MTKENNNPWAGLASYEDPAKSERKLKFCGRDNDIYDVTRLIDDNLLLILYGKSGIGKTSLLNAGVFPKLRQEQYLPVSIRLGTLEANASYQETVISAIEKAIDEVQGTKTIFNVVEEQTDNQQPDRFWNYFARHRFNNAEQEPIFPVVVLDQFEEVLRNTSPEHVGKAQVLLNQLQYLIDESHALSDCIVDGQEYFYDFNFRFVISIREDELYLLEDNIDDLSLSLFRNCRYRLRPMKKGQAKQVVLEPGKDCIEAVNKEAIADQIISMAERDSKSDIDTLLLSLICSELYNTANKKQTIITKTQIVQLGDDVLESFYESTMNAVSASTTVYLEEHLLTQSGFRNSVALEDILHDGISKEEIDKLVKMHLLCNQRINGMERVEFVHDALCKTAKKHRDAREENKQNGKNKVIEIRYAFITTISVLLPLFRLLSLFLDGRSVLPQMASKTLLIALLLTTALELYRLWHFKVIKNVIAKYCIVGVLSVIMFNGFFLETHYTLLKPLTVEVFFGILFLIAFLNESRSISTLPHRILKVLLFLSTIVGMLNVCPLFTVYLLFFFAVFVLNPYRYTEEKNAAWISLIAFSIIALVFVGLIVVLIDVEELFGFKYWKSFLLVSLLFVSVSHYFEFKKTRTAKEAWDYCLSLEIYEKYPFFFKYAAFLLLVSICVIAFIIGLFLNDKYTFIGTVSFGVVAFAILYGILFLNDNSIRNGEKSWNDSIFKPSVLRLHHVVYSFVLLIVFSLSQYFQWHLIWMFVLWVASALLVRMVYNKNWHNQSVFKHIMLWFVPFVLVPLLCFGYNVFTLPQYARVYKGTCKIGVGTKNGQVIKLMKIKDGRGTIGLRDRSNLVIPVKYQRITPYIKNSATYLGGAGFPYCLEKVDTEKAVSFASCNIPQIQFLVIDTQGKNHVWDCSEHLSMNNICSTILLSNYKVFLNYNPGWGAKGLYKFYLNSLCDRKTKPQEIDKTALRYLDNLLQSYDIDMKINTKGQVICRDTNNINHIAMLYVLNRASVLFPYINNATSIEKTIIDSITLKNYDYDSLSNPIDYAKIACWRMLAKDYVNAESDARRSLKENTSPHNYAHVPLIESLFFTQQYDSAFMYLDKFLNKECFIPHIYIHPNLSYWDTASGPDALTKRIFLGDAIWQDFQFYKKMGWISDTLSSSYRTLVSKLKNNAKNPPYSYALRKGWGDRFGEEGSYYYQCMYFHDNSNLYNSDFSQYIMYDNQKVSSCYKRYSICWPYIGFKTYEPYDYLAQKYGAEVDIQKHGYLKNNFGFKDIGGSDYIDRILLIIDADSQKRQYVDLTDGPPKLIPGLFDHAWLFSEGMAVVAVKDSIGVINTKGEYIIRPFMEYKLRYSPIYKQISENKLDGQTHDIMQNWEYYLPKNTNFVYQDGLCPMVNEEGMYGIIDTKGNWIVHPEYNYIDYLKNGFRIIIKNDKYGLMDNASNIILPVVFDQINNEKKYNYISNQWEYTVVIDGEEYSISDFQENINKIIENREQDNKDLSFVKEEQE